MGRLLALIYGAVAYVLFLGTFLYAVGFIGNFAVPKAMDSGADGPLGQALLVNAALLALFAIQHSTMARPAVKRWLTRVVPRPIERSTYVLASSLLLLLLFWQWRPMGGVIWQVTNPTGRLVLYAMFAAGWLTVLTTTFLIDHFDLFGLRQVYLYWRRQPYTAPAFATPGPYAYVRHPLYVGWFLAFWSTPTMTAAHLLFAVMTTAYILVAIQFEEHDLIEYYGDAYRRYRERVPMIVPIRRAKADVGADKSIGAGV